MRRRLTAQPRWQLGLAAAVVMVMAGASYLAGRELISADPRAANGTASPDPQETPAARPTPDGSRPDWYLAAEAEERMAPKFQGELNGIVFDEGEPPTADRSPQPYCPGWRSEPDWEEAIVGTPFEVNLDDLPPGFIFIGPPQVHVCEDGRPVRLWIEIYSGGRGVHIVRLEGVRTWPQLYSEGRLSAGTIAGRPAVFVTQIAERWGESAVFIVDPETGGSTWITAVDFPLEFTIALATSLYE